jgi:hypothetical protein
MRNIFKINRLKNLSMAQKMHFILLHHSSRRDQLVHKISWKNSLIGIIFLLSSMCLSDAVAQTDPYPYLTMEEGDREEPRLSPLEPLIGEEYSDDSRMEILLTDRRRRGAEFDIPIVVNYRVEQFIQCFQTTLRPRFATWLARSNKYIPFMRSVLSEHGLPEDLVYLALIESGFNPYAYSRARAVGMWQFIS